MTDTLTNILAFAFALGVIIIVHEAGHLLVAKAFNVKVLAFSIGFGRSLWSFRRGETEYRLSILPLGGYVRMDGEGLEEGINDSLQPADRAGQAESSADDPRRFTNKPRWQRILIYLAGPTMNVLLAVGLFAALFIVGIEVPNLPDMPPIIGSVEAGSSAAAAGLQRGDRILTVNRERAPSWAEVGLALLTSPDKPVSLSVQRGARTFAATVTPKRIPRYETGDFAGLFPSLQPRITKVDPKSPAEAAGLKVGDEIRTVDGIPMADSKDFSDAIAKRPGQRVDLQLLRDGRLMSLQAVPRNDGGAGRIGVGIGIFQRYPPGQAVVESVKYNIQIVSETFKVLGKIVRREMSAKGALAGPIEMARQSGAAARVGFKYLLHLMGFISISIAILNLMPIPILDGGQIFILLVEEVIRRDLSLRVKEVITQVGFVLILMLMGVVLWFDLGKII
jgi:regulator of sigma E protease